MPDEAFLNPLEHPVGTRLLLRSDRFSSQVVEVTVVEWSPLKDYVKLNYPVGASRWVPIEPTGPTVASVLPGLPQRISISPPEEGLKS